MSFVFVSHANQDKPRIRHIVDALIADGHKVWLDNPVVMKYDADQIRADFVRIPAGTRWKDEIDEAVMKAGAVLVCFSERINEPRRDTWHDEIAIARANGTLVGCRIDDVDSQKLRNQYSLQQLPDVRDSRPERDLKTALALLVEDVRRVLARTYSARAEARRQQKRNPFSPYLVDRTPHEDEIGRAIEAIDRDGGAQALFIAGPENECVDEFIDRLKDYTCPRHSKRGSWHRLPVEWPDPQQAFVTSYLRNCARELGVAADEAAIATALAAKDKLVAVVSHIGASEWQPDEEQRLSDWLHLWHRLAGHSQCFSALPILCLKMPRAEAGWKTYPRGTAAGGSFSNAQIWQAANALQGRPNWWSRLRSRPSPERIAMGIPPLLHPITRGHADTWLDHSAIRDQLDDLQEVRRLMGRVFIGQAAIPLEAFAIEMKPLFQGGG